MTEFIIRPGQTVLFQGDSITDGGRGNDPEFDMGFGYPKYISSWLSAKYSEHNINFVNRGISGNRICDLESRWNTDCIDIKPDLVSILIGINDTWRRFDSNSPSDIPEFEACYRRLLYQVKSETGATIIIIEPFVLPSPADRVEWRIDLDPRIQATRRVAADYGAIYIPLDGILAAACARREPAFWAQDGVHPTPAGHALIAQEWIRAVGG